ncbi:MAG: VWA domain-containing protein [Acidobacteriota bacterium]
MDAPVGSRSAFGHWGTSLLLVMATVTVLGQTAPGQPSMLIASPVEGTLISGKVVLHADLDPPAAASSVVFFVDGRQVCTVTVPPYECTRDVGTAVVAHQVRVVANISGGTRIVRNVRTKELGYTEKVDVEVVQVTATVVDNRGHYVKGLPREAFHVFEDDHGQTITHFASEDVPLELIVAVDISGSMAAAMPKLKSAVKAFLEAVPARDQVTVLGFNDTVFALTRATTQPADRAKAVDRLAAWGGTALYDVILRAVDMAGRQAGRKAIIVFTDGEDEGSHSVIADVEERLQASDATLYMIGQGRGVTLDPLKRVMERLSRPTGGRALFTESIDELHDAFDKLLDELSQQYLLGYPPTKNAHDDAFRRIKVTVDGPYQVRARQGYRVSAAK